MFRFISKVISNKIKSNHKTLYFSSQLSYSYSSYSYGSPVSGKVLRNDQLHSLLPRLRRVDDGIQVAGEIEAKLNGTLMDYEFLVDEWPNCKAVVCRVDRSKAQFPIHLGPKVLLFALDNMALESLLRLPGVLDWSSNMTFQFPDHLFRPVMEVLQGKGRLLSFAAVRDVWIGYKTTLKTIDIPSGFHIERIKPHQVPQVDDVWTFKDKQSKEYIEFVAKKLPSTCLINKEGRVVGFAQQYHNGEMGMLHVFEEFRCKGYGRVIMSHLTRSCVETNKVVYALAVGREDTIRVNEAIGLVRLPFRKMFYCVLHDK